MVNDTSEERRGAVIYSSVDQLRSPTVLALDAYWRSKQRGRPMPAPSDIDPAENRPLLPSLIIAEYVGAPGINLLLWTLDRPRALGMVAP